MRVKQALYCFEDLSMVHVADATCQWHVATTLSLREDASPVWSLDVWISPNTIPKIHSVAPSGKKKKKYPFHQSHGMLTYLSWQKLYILSLNGRSLSFWANSRACSLTKEFQKVKKKNPSTPAVPSDTKLGVFVNRTLKKMTLKAETMTVSNVHLRNNSDFTFFPKGKKLKWKSTYFRFQSMLYTILNVSNSLGSAINFSSCV